MGRATAEALAAAGAEVAVLDRTGSDGEQAAQAIDGKFFPVDVTDFEGLESTLEQAVAALGGLHVTVTTAGGGIAKRTMSKSGPHDLESFRGVVDLNLVATFNISRLSAAHMSRNEPDEDGERGVIINTSSIAAFEGQIGQVAYSASKAAIAGMTLTMARDLGSLGIRVLAIAPSLFATGATAGLDEERAAPLVAGNAFPKRMGRPQEYAKLALAIVDNPMLNGQCLRLDAGMRFAPK
jgi:NAD(P)-dependent dehydrogenase (short-subunit alcohol dehydrogenase family)